MKKPRVEKSSEVAQHIDPYKPVRVYRNLHKNCLSVKQDGIVRCHADSVFLGDCRFIVSEAGQKRVRDEGRKNVHAFVEGVLVDARETDNYVDGHLSDQEIEWGHSRWIDLYYNPYKVDGFTNKQTGSVVSWAKFVEIDDEIRAFGLA